jgi:hypothetical protein
MRIRFPSGQTAFYGGLVMGLGSTALALRSVTAQQTDWDLSFLNHWLYLSAAYTLLVCGAAIVILWLTGLVVDLIVVTPAKAVAEKFTKVRKRLADLTLAPCLVGDVAEISRLAADEFGALASTVERNKQLLELDNQSYRKLINGNGTILGYYCLFRLTGMGTRALNRGDFDISNCPLEYLRRDNRRRLVNIYIGGLYGKNKKAQAMVWGALNQQGLEIQPRKIFARAASEIGLKRLQHANFVPVRNDQTGLGFLYRRP